VLEPSLVRTVSCGRLRYGGDTRRSIVWMKRWRRAERRERMTVIRPATAADTPAIMALNALGVAESTGLCVQFHTMIERVLVAEVAGSVVGLAAVMPCTGFIPTCSSFTSTKEHRPRCRRALVERVIEDARIAGQREVRLHVHPDNDAAQPDKDRSGGVVARASPFALARHE